MTVVPVEAGRRYQLSTRIAWSAPDSVEATVPYGFSAFLPPACGGTASQPAKVGRPDRGKRKSVKAGRKAGRGR